MPFDLAALFGPGAEWFWVMAQFIALAATGLAIFRQLRAQAWANQALLFGRNADFFDSELMTRYKLAALTQVQRGDPGITPAIERVGSFFDNLGSGRFNGHIHPRYVWDEWGNLAQVYWAVFEPRVADARTHEPRFWMDWERWLVEVRKRDRQAAKPYVLTPEYVARWIAESIAYYRERLRLEDEIKRGVPPTADPGGAPAEAGAPAIVATAAAVAAPPTLAV
jgi:hypothetical protein